MTNRTSYFCLAAAVFALLVGYSAPASAGPGVVVAPSDGTGLVQHVGHRWRYRNGTYVRAPFAEVDTRRDTWVAAPFARVYSGRFGTWVRAPFVNLWVPR